MYEDFLAKRISELRIKKGVSARDMSLSIGQSANYINKIENGKNYPSMLVFFYICDYFAITPKDFFDENNDYPKELNEMINNIKQLDEKSLALISNLIEELTRRKS